MILPQSTRRIAVDCCMILHPDNPTTLQRTPIRFFGSADRMNWHSKIVDHSSDTVFQMQHVKVY